MQSNPSKCPSNSGVVDSSALYMYFACDSDPMKVLVSVEQFDHSIEYGSEVDAIVAAHVERQQPNNFLNWVIHPTPLDEEEAAKNPSI